jgi:hypothetical protein
MYQIKQIYNKYVDEVSRVQYRNFDPVSTLNINAENKKTNFKLDIEDDFISKNIEYYIDGNISHAVAKGEYNLKTNFKLVDNFVAQMFPQIEVKKHNTLIDEIDYTGVASTVKGCVSYTGPNESNDYAINSGFKSLPHGSLNFSVVGRLGDLGFFSDISVPIYKGGFEITFTRNNDNNNIYRWKSLKADGSEDASKLPYAGKVIINNFYLRVPIIKYNSEAKTNLINDLFKENYIFQFKKWQCIQHMKVTGKTLTFDITNIYRNIQNPI